jgi:hypothetical protein
MPLNYNALLKLEGLCPTETPPSDGISKVPRWPRIYYDTPTGEPIFVTEEEFNNMVEFFRIQAAVRDRNKTPK